MNNKDLQYYSNLETSGSTVDHIRLVQPEISGGAILQKEMDSVINNKSYDSILISGLNQKTFDYFIKHHGRKFQAINFWKCPRIADLSPIAQLNSIKYVLYFWNQGAVKLWDLKSTPSLRGLCLNDFTKLKSLDGIEQAKELTDLEFGNKVWVKSELNSLATIGKCTNLTSLTLSIKSVKDNRILPLQGCAKLKRIEFPTNLFTVDQIAWLKSKLPNTIVSRVLQPYIQMSSTIKRGTKNLDTLVIGKKMPFLDSSQDKIKLDKYINNFNTKLRFFVDNPAISPDE